MKFFLTIAVTATIFGHAESVNNNSNSLYLGVGVSAEIPTWYNGSLAGALTLGKPLIKAGQGWIGAEAEVTNTLIDGSKNNVDFSATTLAGYATYIFDIDSKLYIKPRVGVVYKKYDINSEAWGTKSTTELGIAYGFGVGIRFTDNINIYANYTMVENSDLMHLTTGLEYHF